MSTVIIYATSGRGCGGKVTPTSASMSPVKDQVSSPRADQRRLPEARRFRLSAREDELKVVIERIREVQPDHRRHPLVRGPPWEKGVEPVGVQGADPKAELPHPVVDLVTDETVLPEPVPGLPEDGPLVRRDPRLPEEAGDQFDRRSADRVAKHPLEPRRGMRMLREQSDVAQQAVRPSRDLPQLRLADPHQAEQLFEILGRLLFDDLDELAVLRPAAEKEEIKLLVEDVEEVAGRRRIGQLFVDQVFGIERREGGRRAVQAKEGDRHPVGGRPIRSLLDPGNVGRRKPEGKVRADPQVPVRSFPVPGRLLSGAANPAQEPQRLEKGESVPLLQEIELQIKGRFPIRAGHR